MALDLNKLDRLVRIHHRVARIVIVEVKGSAPRDAGTEMFVWETGQYGTIGGGALEHQAIADARSGIGNWKKKLFGFPLGPSLGQCCGGFVRLLTEIYEPATLPKPERSIFARAVVDGSESTERIRNLLDKIQRDNSFVESNFMDGWFIESILEPGDELWIWGAGHVGRAIVDIMAGLPDLMIKWVDIHSQRFPEPIPEQVEKIATAKPNILATYCDPASAHVVVTHSHQLDLDLCHGLLLRGVINIGLIGSATKWARFRKRLKQLGHTASHIEKITCPIGEPCFGKHPKQIAIGVAQNWLKEKSVYRKRIQQHE